MKSASQVFEAINTATIQIDGKTGKYCAMMRCRNCAQFLNHEFYGDVVTDIQRDPKITLPAIPNELPRLRSMLELIERIDRERITNTMWHYLAGVVDMAATEAVTAGDKEETEQSDQK
jgi:D-mannonate dehydratase